MAGRKLTANVLVEDEAGKPVVLEVGSEVPSWASDQVGDHCFDAADNKTAAPKKTANRK